MNSATVDQSYTRTVENAISTSGASPESLVTDVENENTGKWSDLIAGTLVAWEINPSVLDDDELITPTIELIRKAIREAQAWRKKCLPAPHGIVADGNGGIVFFWRFDHAYQRIEFRANSEIELIRIENGNVATCQRLQ